MIENDTRHPKERQALGCFVKLLRAAESIAAATRDVFENAGLTESQFGVLELLYHTGPQSQLAIGKKILKSKGNITLVVNNLEKEGYVMRQKSQEDRRYYNVNLTPKGHKLIEEIFPKHSRLVAKKMSKLSTEELITLGSLCKKLGRSLN